MGIISSIRDLMTPTVEITETFRFEVNDVLSFEQQVAAGNYDFINDAVGGCVRPRLASIGISHFEGVLFRFWGSSDQAVERIAAADKANPWELAEIEHLLAFGAAFPNKQRKYQIYALDSMMNLGECRLVPYIGTYKGGERALHLHDLKDVQGPEHHILAVRRL
ncbi:hypothetical protein K2Q08_00825 [Patescibacteria group bacterium]|nr:hypothetical protein [Patescibacteria group bacterium]